MVYYDTAIIVKLYTNEPESKAVQKFVTSKAVPLQIHAFHLSETASALHLKAFRGECTQAQANHAFADVEEDLRKGILREINPDWPKIFQRCISLSRSHAATTGCRTLDTLHISCAMELGCREFVTSDHRQATLANLLGFNVLNPT